MWNDPKRLIRSERGNVAVEFALIAPVLILMMIGVLDMGLAVAERMRLSNAARAGTHYAFLNPTDSAGITQAVTNALDNPSAPATITLTTACQCPDGSAAPCGGGAGLSCTTEQIQTYLTISVSLTHALLFPYPLLDSPVQLQARSSLRIG